MKLIIDISENVIEEAKSSPNYYPTYHFEKIWRAIANGTPLPNITDEQISDAFQIAIANYWEEKSKYLTPPPTPVQCRDCSNEKRGTFVARPIEVIKMGEPLSNSDEIRAALEKGEIYKRGFEDARKRFERPTGKWIDEGNQYGEHWFKCSVCDTSTIVQTTWDSTRWNIPLYNYCPYCGARMVKDDEKG